MSSRLTVPVSKFTRSISTTPSIARPSHLLNNGSKATTVKTTRKRQTKIAAPAASIVADETTESTRTAHTTTTPHRPSLPAVRTIPLMQGFRTSAPKPARADRSTIDFAVLPDLTAHDMTPDAFYVRVPLLPDNHSPPAGTHLPESFDAPLPRAEISVVAVNPDLVLPSALTEVEGMGVDGVELSFAHDLHREAEPEQQGMLRDIWKGLIDDVFGEKKVAL